jgi:A/G-specific adenine glycosylase
MSSTTNFSTALLTWYDHHGRKQLPWQHPRSAYRVWISEIMLQQTQVATVIPYYKRFMLSFPDVVTLANAPLDAVLQHWSGLGYYARARNMHKAALEIRDRYHGVFPSDFDSVVNLPGIGRSTAGAILALSAEQRHPILDGNVKRVLARYCAIEGWPGAPKVTAQLWDKAEELTPHTRLADYTQAIMDLGATLCTRAKPLCEQCPVRDNCIAYIRNKVANYPTARPQKEKPVRSVQVLLLTNEENAVLLERRPLTGIWGGLLGLPELEPAENPRDWAKQHIGAIEIVESWQSFRHTFSHFHLDMQPVIARLKAPAPRVTDNARWVWFEPGGTIGGLAAPVQMLIGKLNLISSHQGTKARRT